MVNPKKILLFTFCLCGAILFFHLIYTNTSGAESTKSYYFSDNTVPTPLKSEKKSEDELKSKSDGGIRIFCYISTAPKHLETRAIAVNNTWARLCDKYFFITSIYHDNDNVLFSNRTIEIHDPLPILQVAGMVVEKYSRITDKVYGAYKHIYAKYPDYDWYMKADDDTFVFMDNLRSFLTKKDPHGQGEFTYGYNFKIGVTGGYHSGGAGIAIGNRALKAIGSALTKNDSNCPNTGIDDKDLNVCLRDLGFKIGDSLDEKGREHFHPVHAMAFFRKGHIPDWLTPFASNPLRDGADCCADETTTFHYATPEQMYVLQNLFDKYKAEKGLPFNFTELLVDADKTKEFI